MTALLDEARLTTLLELYDIERRRALLALFEEQARMGLEGIAQAAADGDGAAAAAAAHRLASCAASFACAALHARARQLAHPETQPTAVELNEQREQLEMLYVTSVKALHQRLLKESPKRRMVKSWTPLPAQDTSPPE